MVKILTNYPRKVKMILYHEETTFFYIKFVFTKWLSLNVAKKVTFYNLTFNFSII